METRCVRGQREEERERERERVRESEGESVSFLPCGAITEGGEGSSSGQRGSHGALNRLWRLGPPAEHTHTHYSDPLSLTQQTEPGDFVRPLSREEVEKELPV